MSRAICDDGSLRWKARIEAIIAGSRPAGLSAAEVLARAGSR